MRAYVGVAGSVALQQLSTILLVGVRRRLAYCTAPASHLSCRTLHPAGCRWRLSPWQCAATSICRGTQVPSMLPGQWGGSLVEHSVYSELMSLGMVKVATRKPTHTSLSTRTRLEIETARERRTHKRARTHTQTQDNHVFLG